jgi:hypothetical protein
MNASAVAGVAEPRHVPLAFKAIDRQRHRPGGDAHVAREIVQCHRIDLIEVIEHARLMPAEVALRLRIVDVARVTREEDSRIELHQSSGGRSNLAHARRSIFDEMILFCQIKYNCSKLL